MKANEAPEKLYFGESDRGLLVTYSYRESNDEVEYTRTDAFIEKACDAYCRLCDTKECGGTGECVWVEKFRKRLMK